MFYKAFFILLLALSDSVFAVDAPVPAKGLYITWPQGWQVAKEKVEKSVMYQNARLQKDGKTIQDLQITAINVQHGQKPMTRAMVRQLIDELHNKVQQTATDAITISSFSTAQGYYFAAIDKNPRPGDFTQMIEGLIFDRGYLINFTLLTNAAGSADSNAMVSALDHLSIR